MKFDKMTTRILVRKDYGACFDFYTEKLGLIAVWGDRKGPYTSFAVSKDAAPCFAIFLGDNMTMFSGYEQPAHQEQSDTVVGVIPSENLQEDYEKLKAAGVEFLGEPQYVNEWYMTCVYFRDPEGNLFELNDATTV
ncbi:VOC family protein [Enterococcus sp. BWR-S5]|uniref:VOC family protein n=1 Tax=Enterococcus sp. BWR-S5 TaxID=2787714 RepID=UPI0019227004|nr:VOC family protein [Enterococcus sp. BWR-S5]MBL1226072.1 VOC family protein [Enterococcus sp. BWR-S5]